MHRRFINPLISVVIPTYNRAQMVSQAIASVLEQDFSDFELIVVDDGSTDDTPEILNGLRQVNVIRQANRGVSAARNAGIAVARGRLIAFLDSDDLWLPGKLSAQADFFASRPEAKVCQTAERWMKNGRRVTPKRYHRKPSGFFFEKSLERCLVSPSAVMVRRTLFAEVGGFDEALPACEDYDLWLRIGRCHPIYLIEQVLTIKRGGHANQLSSQPGLDRFRIRSLKTLLATGGLTPRQAQAAKAVLQHKCRIYAGGCLKRGRTQEAAHYLGMIAD